MRIVGALSIVIALTSCFSGASVAVDLLSAESAVRSNSAGSWAKSDPLLSNCEMGDPEDSITLPAAAERAICFDPQTHKAWANAKEAAAGLGLARARFLPQIDAGAQKEWGHNVETTNNGILDLNSSAWDTSRSVNLTWLLFDFGGNVAKLTAAKQSLLASLATQDDVIHALVLSVVSAYYDAYAALAALNARRESEQLAYDGWNVANARYLKGVASLADALQTRNAYFQAQLDHIKADSDFNTKRGALATLVGLRPDFQLKLDSQSIESYLDHSKVSFEMPSEGTIEEQPSVVAAKAGLRAAEANLRAARATGMPTVSLVGTLSHSEQYPDIEYRIKQTLTTANRQIGIKITIPISDSIAREYTVYQARADVESKASDLREAEQKVSSAIWNSFQAELAARLSLAAATEQLSNARRSYEVASGRFRNGVGSTADFLNAQSALTNAQLQKAQITATWLTARITLAANAGPFDITTLLQ
jgi:outer membrane protein